MAGIQSSMEKMQTDWACIIPVDAPLVPTNLVTTLANAAFTDETSTGQARLTLLVVEGRTQPLFGLYPKKRLPDLQARYAEGERKLIRWCESQSPLLLEWNGDSIAFTNCNTPESLKALTELHR
jgi:molybdopterin-guanine dinucleotide biosynthesis protein A